MMDDLAVGTDWVQEQVKRGEAVFFVEVRHAGDLDLAVMKARGALRLTHDDARKRISEIPKERLVVVYSTAPDDQPALELARLLLSQGATKVHVLAGGFKAYRSAGLPVEEIGAGSNMTRARGL
jgi:rhodanese-related sulfurtransferase